MTRNWTDYPLSRFIPIKKIHITELYQAYEERLRFLRADSNRTTAHFPLPVFYYDKPNAKLWGDDYPKADPAHWPPNESPDNKVRNDHIYNIRYCVPGAISSTASDGAERPDGVYYGAYSYSFVGNFIKPDDAYYRPYDAGNNVGFQPFQDALGRADYTDPTLTAGSVYVKADHINEARKMLEQLRTVYINASSIQYRFKFFVTGYYSTTNAAWAALKTGIANESWSGWGGAPFNIWLIDAQFYENGSSQYRAEMYQLEHRFTFDLDLEISDMGWSVLPPLSAKLCVAGYAAFEYTADPWNDYDHLMTADISCMIKCSTTSVELDLPQETCEDTGPYGHAAPEKARKGYVLDPDIKNYVGNGHGSEQFILTARDDFSSDELDELRPDDPSGAYAMSCKTVAWLSPTWCTPPNNMAGMCYVVIEPNWKYGAP